MVSHQRILLVAAEPREFDGLLPLCADVRKLDWPVYWGRYGELQGRQFWMIANGAGASHAGQAAEIACREGQPEAIVSTGFCGGIDPALRIGDVFVATAIGSSPVCMPKSVAPHTTGVLASIDRVAQTAAEKRQLRTTGAAAVEMEAAGVARVSSEQRIPFFCVRSVTDTATQSFVTDFNRALRPDGHFGTMRILASAIRNPGKAFPELIRLRNSCGIASRALGAFIAGCRF